MQVVAEDTKVQFRGDAERVRFVRQQGLNPNDIARAAFDERVDRMRGDEWLARMRELQKHMKPWKPGDMAKAVRESRDDDH